MLLVFLYILLQLTLRILNISLRAEGNVLLHYNHLIIACPPSAQYASRHCFYNTFRRCFVHPFSSCIKHRDCICLRNKTVRAAPGSEHSGTIKQSSTAQCSTMEQLICHSTQLFTELLLGWGLLPLNCREKPNKHIVKSTQGMNSESTGILSRERCLRAVWRWGEIRLLNWILFTFMKWYSLTLSQAR